MLVFVIESLSHRTSLRIMLVVRTHDNVAIAKYSTIPFQNCFDNPKSMSGTPQTCHEIPGDSTEFGLGPPTPLFSSEEPL